MKLDLKPGQECELCNMLVECCSQEKGYNKFYGNIAARFCLAQRRWMVSWQKKFLKRKIYKHARNLLFISQAHILLPLVFFFYFLGCIRKDIPRAV